MKSKCGKFKIKGWKAEQKIDEMLEIKTIFPVSIEYEKDCRKVFKQAKTYIQSLNNVIKSYRERIDELWDTIEDCEGEISQLRKEKDKLKQEFYETKGNIEFKTDEKYFWKKCCEEAEQKVKEQSSTINQLQFDNDALSKIVEELRKEKEKLKDDLSDCVMSNELLERENTRLRDTLSDISFRTPALGGDKKEMKRALLDIDELCRISLDREDEE